MTLTPLTNARWGFESMCFVCEEANERGMRIPFFHDDETGTVSAEFTLTEAFSGAPAFGHGGVLMAITDEAMCWATIAGAGTWAVTASNTHRFLRPVRLGRPYRVEAHVAGQDDRGISATALIGRDAPGSRRWSIFKPIGDTSNSAATAGTRGGRSSNRIPMNRLHASVAGSSLSSVPMVA